MAGPGFEPGGGTSSLEDLTVCELVNVIWMFAADVKAAYPAGLSGTDGRRFGQAAALCDSGKLRLERLLPCRLPLWEELLG